MLVTLFTCRTETSHGFLPITYGRDRRKSRSKKRSCCSRRHRFHQRADAIARGLGSSQRPKPALASCGTVDAPLVDSARQKLRGNKTCWTSTWKKQERHELPSPRHPKKNSAGFFDAVRPALASWKYLTLKGRKNLSRLRSASFGRAWDGRFWASQRAPKLSTDGGPIESRCRPRPLIPISASVDLAIAGSELNHLR